VAHRVEAGSDLFVMPSLFEPCGLNQFYSQRYGTPPIVRRTGGLADSVVEGPDGTGFVFAAPHGKALRDAMYRAITLFRDDPEAMVALRRRCMLLDRSWGPAIAAYEGVYERALARRNPR
jgi:starch synthase